jgi:hypothetical protein
LLLLLALRTEFFVLHWRTASLRQDQSLTFAAVSLVSDEQVQKIMKEFGSHNYQYGLNKDKFADIMEKFVGSPIFFSRFVISVADPRSVPLRIVTLDWVSLLMVRHR